MNLFKQRKKLFSMLALVLMLFTVTATLAFTTNLFTDSRSNVFTDLEEAKKKDQERGVSSF